MINIIPNVFCQVQYLQNVKTLGSIKVNFGCISATRLCFALYTFHIAKYSPGTDILSQNFGRQYVEVCRETFWKADRTHRGAIYRGAVGVFYLKRVPLAFPIDRIPFCCAKLRLSERSEF